MSIIYDSIQVKKFINLFPPLEQHEVLFVSLSARNTYLTEDERRHYNLGRSEMFGRRLIRNNDDYERILTSLVDSLPSFRTRNGQVMPEKSLVVYANINPSSGVKALKQFNDITNGVVMQEVESYGKYQHNNWKKLDTLLMNCYQRAQSKKVFVDIDCDTKDIKIINEMLDVFKENLVKYYVIVTKSGYHVLIDKSTIKFNYTGIVQEAHRKIIDKYGEGEIIVNTNAMVPVPGTLQAGFQVRFI